MNIDFPTVLVVASFVSGMIWLLDSLLFAPQRRRDAENEAREQSKLNVQGAAAVAGSMAANSLTGDGEDTPVSDVHVKEPLIVEYARSFFPVIFAVLILRSFIAEPFRIPSGSMMPTLLVGDFILVNKFAYGLRLPSINKKVIDIGLPERGDVVVFRYPKEPSVDYIKRAIGIPGDTISYKNKTLRINGKEQPQVQVGQYVGVGSGIGQTGWTKSVESIGEIEHTILRNPRAPNLPAGCQVLRPGVITVPDGHYFVMGDNRDNSNDGRCWGFVPEENLVGKAFAIWMHWDSGRDGSIPIAWERLGSGIN
jgi:signal peptidase I